jgi:hypothetical protein
MRSAADASAGPGLPIPSDRATVAVLLIGAAQ